MKNIRNVWNYRVGLVLLILFSSINTGLSQEEELQLHTPYPIIFVHGLVGDETSWSVIKDFLETNYGLTYGKRMDFCLNQDGDYSTSDLSTDYKDYTNYDDLHRINKGDFYIINFDVDNYGTPHDIDLLSNQSAIVKQGKALKDAVKHVLEITEKDKVILIGHSMGGLAVREFIRSHFNNDVAKIVTIGTPHYGSDLARQILFIAEKLIDFPVLSSLVAGLADLDTKSDAVRDLNPNSIYLFGGDESSVSEFYYCSDVNCNGSTIDFITGLNEDYKNLEMVARTYIVSRYSKIFGLNGDGIVAVSSQYISPNDTIMTDRFHLGEDGESKDVYSIIRGLDEPHEKELAYELGINIINKGFITFNAFNSALDVDLYKIKIEKDGILTLTFEGNENTGITRIILMDVETNPLITINNISEKLEYNVAPGTYYLQIRGLAKSGEDASYKNPYTINTSFAEEPQALLETNPKNTLEYYDVVVNNYRDKNVVLTNKGTSAISVTDLSLSGTNSEEFSIATSFPFDLAPEESKSLTVRLNPTINGEKSATLNITSNAGEENIKTISLHGFGVDSPTKRLVVSPDIAYNFGNVTITKTKTKTFNLQNTGSDALTISDLSLSGTNLSDYFILVQPTIPFDLTSGKQKQVTLQFTPSTIGVKNVNFVISNNSDNGSPEYSIALYGNGTNSIYTGIYNTITAYEYWFDNDYPSKIFTSITPTQEASLNTTIPTDNFENGLHRYNIRFRDNLKRWSSVSSQYFQKLPAQPEGERVITAFEYWFDNDYTIKELVPVSASQEIITGEIAFDELPEGLHSLHIRYRDDARQWSSVSSQYFQKLPIQPEGERVITAYEYWFDNDYSTKEMISVSPSQEIITGEIAFDELPEGLHSLHIRYRDDAKQWSSVTSQYFQKLRVTNLENNMITAYRYWFDEDFGRVVTITLPVPVNPFDRVWEINTGSLTTGNHSVHFQFMDLQHAWSSVNTSEFYYEMPPVPPVAAFMADNEAPYINQTITIIDNSEFGPESWLWEITPNTFSFTGGTTENSQNPKVQFNAEGAYAVRLTVANAYGSDTETKVNYLNVSSGVSYRTRNSGDWGNSAVWQFNDGAVWLDSPGNTGNLYPGATGNNDIALIRTGDQVTVNSTATLKYLTLNPGGMLTVSTGQELNVSGNLNVQSDKNNAGSILNRGNMQVNGVTMVESYIPSANWHIVSSPVGGQDLRDFAYTNSIESLNHGTYIDYDLAPYDEALGAWDPYIISDGSNSSDFAVSKGYSLRRSLSEGKGNVRYEGIQHEVNKDISITRIRNGWNCVGNPFISSIWAKGSGGFLEVNRNELDQSYAGLYLWDESQDDYFVITEATFEFPTLGGESALNQDKIAVGQGFIIKSKIGGGTITFPLSLQNHSPQTEFKSSAISWPTIRLIASSGELKNSTIITFNDRMSRGLDPSYDVGKFKANNDFALYTRLLDDNNVDFAVQALPDNKFDSYNIPVGLDFYDGGLVTFTVESINLPVGVKVYLNDIQNKITKQMDFPGSNYTTMVDAGTQGTGRFYISFENRLNTNLAAEIENDFNVFTDSKIVYVIGQSIGKTKIQLFSIDGKLIYNDKVMNLVNKEIDASSFPAGIYLLKIANSDQVKSVKLLLGN